MKPLIPRMPTVLSTVTLMLHCCVCRRLLCVCNVCIVAKRLEQKLLLTALQQVAYEKSIGTKMNELDLCLEVV